MTTAARIATSSTSSTRQSSFRFLGNAGEVSYAATLTSATTQAIMPLKTTVVSFGVENSGKASGTAPRKKTKRGKRAGKYFGMSGGTRRDFYKR